MKGHALKPCEMAWLSLFSFSHLLCDDSCQGCPCPYGCIPGGPEGSPACLSPLHHHPAGTCPTRERCPLLPELSQPIPAVPSTAGKGKQDHDPHSETECWSTLSGWSGQQLPPRSRRWGWGCHHKMLHFASLAFGPKITKWRGKSSAFHDIWIRLSTFHIKQCSLGYLFFPLLKQPPKTNNTNTSKRAVIWTYIVPPNHYFLVFQDTCAFK